VMARERMRWILRACVCIISHEVGYVGWVLFLGVLRAIDE
jgi:hypothetical protein